MRRSIALLTSLALLCPVSAFAQNEATAEQSATNGGTLTVAPVVIESPATEQPVAVQAEVPVVAVPPAPVLPSAECMRLCSATTPYANCAALCVSPDYTPPAQQIVYQAPTRLAYEPQMPKKPRYKYVGLQFDLSLPSGVALGVIGRAPQVPWLKFGVAATGTLMPGIRGNITFDPFEFPIVPLINVDVGHQFPFSIPAVKNSPSVEFSYTDFQGGLGLGKQNGARFELLAGYSYIWGTTNNFQGVLPTVPGLTVGNPSFNGWVPSAKVGFSILF